MDIKDHLENEEDEMKEKAYLGTFRWKRTLQFPLLGNTTVMTYDKLSKWSDYINQRLTFQFEPYIVDALSYPMSIIYALNCVFQTKQTDLSTMSEVNIIILGASSKTECRIALESNYFDELYYYFLQKTGNGALKASLYFVGEEVPNNNSYDSKSWKNLKYYFYTNNTGKFLKENIMNFNKKNTFICGLNCGFGSGYLKLTLSWFTDLVLLLKINYLCIFTYTNDYEDKKGEIAIVQGLLGGNVIIDVNDNPFKSMTTYKSEENEQSWSCGNFGFYAIEGGKRDIITKMSKLSLKEIEELIQKTITIKIL